MNNPILPILVAVTAATPAAAADGGAIVFGGLAAAGALAALGGLAKLVLWGFDRIAARYQEATERWVAEKQWDAARDLLEDVLDRATDYLAERAGGYEDALAVDTGHPAFAEAVQYVVDSAAEALSARGVARESVPGKLRARAAQKARRQKAPV